MAFRDRMDRMYKGARQGGKYMRKGGEYLLNAPHMMYEEGVSETLLPRDEMITNISSGGSAMTLIASLVGFGGKIVSVWLVNHYFRTMLDDSEDLMTDDATFKTMNYLGYFGQANLKSGFQAPTDENNPGVLVDGSVLADWSSLDAPTPFSNLKQYVLASAVLTTILSVFYALRMIPAVEQATFGANGNLFMNVASTLLYHVFDGMRYLILSFDVLIFAWAEIFSYQLDLGGVHDATHTWIQVNFVFSIFLATALSHIERQIVAMGIARAGVNFRVPQENVMNFRKEYLRPVRGEYNDV